MKDLRPATDRVNECLKKTLDDYFEFSGNTYEGD